LSLNAITNCIVNITYSVMDAGLAPLEVFVDIVTIDIFLTTFVGLFVGASINYTFRKMHFLDEARSELATNYLICVAIYSACYSTTLAMLYLRFPMGIAGGIYRLGHCVNYFSIMLFLSDTTAAIKENRPGKTTGVIPGGSEAVTSTSKI
jgi:DMSO/TMAO reductase YedYZ heme-binding membrane subunit